MNKKAQFFTITAFLFILVMILVFSYIAGINERKSTFRLTRVQDSVMNSFVDDFDSIYLPKIFETATKPALQETVKIGVLTENDFKQEIESIMKTGEDSSGNEVMNYDVFSTDSLFLQSTGTLTFDVKDNSEFEYDFIDIKQFNYTTLKLQFSVDYKFESNSSKWEKNDKEITVYVDVFGLQHPGWSGKRISKIWVKDDSDNCYVNEIISDSNNCGGMDIAPFLIDDDLIGLN